MATDFRTGKQGGIRFGGRDSVSGDGNRDDWRTPPALMAEIYDRWSLNWDPCPFPRAPGYDALAIPWHGRAYVNPPYGKMARRFIQKAVAELGAGRLEVAVFLVHSRTDTNLFHVDLLPHAKELWFVKGRIPFVPASGGMSHEAGFGSLIAVLGKEVGGDLLVGQWDLKTGAKTERSRGFR